MKAAMEFIELDSSYQFGLLHFAHLLVTVDGVMDDREVNALKEICLEENITEEVFKKFQADIASKTEKEVYQKGVELLSGCTDQEKLCAIVHLFQLSEADDNIHEKEVRLLFYSVKGTNVDFEDVEMTSRLLKSQKQTKSRLIA